MNQTISHIAQKVERELKESQICEVEGLRVEKLMQRMEQKQLTIAVLGQFKRGKSSVMNVVLGENVLPVGIVPITSVVTSVRYGEKRAEVVFNNGRNDTVDIDTLHTYISEQKNKNNKLGVSHVDIYMQNSFLKQGITLVDTPGVGSYHVHNTETAYAFMKESDAVIFLLSVDSPINQIEIDFLKSAKENASKFYFAVNKVDIIDESELKEYMEYCTDLLKEIMENDKFSIFAVSAKTQAGIDDMINKINEDMALEVDGILENSMRIKLMDIIKDSIAHLNLNFKVLNMPWPELTKKFDELNKYITEVKNHSEELLNNSDEQINFLAEINEYKIGIAKKIHELFNMEYPCPINPIDDMLKTKDQRKTFRDDVDSLCHNIEQTLKSAVMYKEENAYTVVRHINKINKLTRSLRTTYNLLKIDEPLQ